MTVRQWPVVAIAAVSSRDRSCGCPSVVEIAIETTICESGYDSGCKRELVFATMPL